jgi:hypothetical protein
MDLVVLNKFESVLKRYKTQFFTKLYEESENTHKLIYSLQGLDVDGRFFTNINLYSG